MIVMQRRFGFAGALVLLASIIVGCDKKEGGESKASSSNSQRGSFTEQDVDNVRRLDRVIERSDAVLGNRAR